MSVRVYLSDLLRRFSGGILRVDVEAQEQMTVGDVMDVLEARWPGIKTRVCGPGGEVRPVINIFKNGTEIRRLQGLRSPVRTGDEIAIIPATRVDSEAGME